MAGHRPNEGRHRDSLEEGTITTAHSHYDDYQISRDELLLINSHLPYLIRRFPQVSYTNSADRIFGSFANMRLTQVYIYFEEHYFPHLGKFNYHLVMLSGDHSAVDICRKEMLRLGSVKGERKRVTASHKKAAMMEQALKEGKAEDDEDDDNEGDDDEVEEDEDEAGVVDDENEGMVEDEDTEPEELEDEDDDENEWVVEEEAGDNGAEVERVKDPVRLGGVATSAAVPKKGLATHIAVDLSNVGQRQNPVSGVSFIL